MDVSNHYFFLFSIRMCTTLIIFYTHYVCVCVRICVFKTFSVPSGFRKLFTVLSARKNIINIVRINILHKREYTILPNT